MNSSIHWTDYCTGRGVSGVECGGALGGIRAGGSGLTNAGERKWSMRHMLVLPQEETQSGTAAIFSSSCSAPSVFLPSFVFLLVAERARACVALREGRKGERKEHVDGLTC